jgi:hypothetical protein
MQSYKSNYTIVVKKDDGFVLSLDQLESDFLRTPAGSIVSYKNEEFIAHIASELEQFITLKTQNGALIEDQLECITSYSLFSGLIDFIQGSELPSIQQVSFQLTSDPLLNSFAGPERSDQLRNWNPIASWLDLTVLKDHEGMALLCSGIGLVDTGDESNNVYEFIVNMEYEGEENEPKLISFEEFSTVIRDVWSTLTDPQRVVVEVLRSSFSSLLAALCFIKKGCTESEFSLAVLAGVPELAIAKGSASDIPTFIGGEIVDFSVTPEGYIESENQRNYKEVIEIVRTCDYFLRLLAVENEINRIIEKGESKSLEFKETLSLDVRTNKKEKYIEHSALKTVVAFLNSIGGTLLIGVGDDGLITGVEKEINKLYKMSTDKFLLHFKNLIKTRIGEQFYPFVEYNIIKSNGKNVLRVDCLASSKPCYLDNEGFYVRMNPATDKLEGPKLVEYVQHHFGSIE